MSVDNRSYYRARAEQELMLAGTATDAVAAAAHANLARLFKQKSETPPEDDELSWSQDGVVADFGGDAGNFRQIPRSGPA